MSKAFQHLGMVAALRCLRVYGYTLMMMPSDKPTRVGSADSRPATAWLMFESVWLNSPMAMPPGE